MVENYAEDELSSSSEVIKLTDRDVSLASENRCSKDRVIHYEENVIKKAGSNYLGPSRAISDPNSSPSVQSSHRQSQYDLGELLVQEGEPGREVVHETVIYKFVSQNGKLAKRYLVMSPTALFVYKD